MAFKTRDAVLAYQESKTDSETHMEDLDVVDPISAITLEVTCTNGATSNKGNFISDIVSKVEVVDGSDTLVSLSGAQLQALEFYKTKQLPCVFPSEWGSGSQREQFNILFGRYLWDKEYALNPARFRKPQLKITFNKAAIRAAGATGFASGTNIYLTIVVKLIEEGARASAYFMQKQIRSWTTSSSGDEQVPLPVDYPYRLAMIRGWLSGYDINEIFSDVKITCDKDKFIPLNRNVQQLDAEAIRLFGLCHYKHDALVYNNAEVRVIPNKEPEYLAKIRNPAVPRVIVPYAQWSSIIYTQLYDMDGALDGTERQATGVVWGHAPHATLCIPFGLMDDPTTWFNAPSYGDIDLVLTQATASGAASVVLEQIRPN